jgi:hypothetical protein
MHLDRIFAKVKLSRDLLVEFPLDHWLHDLTLAQRKLCVAAFYTGDFRAP